MIKPPKAEIITDGAKRKKVYLYEHRALEKYCEHLEKVIRGYQKDVNQYSKLSNDSIELGANNKKVEVVLLAD